MRGLSFSPRHIVDVGAHRGYWTRNAIEFFPDAHYEPQAELRKYVEDLIAAGFRIGWINAGMSDVPGRLGERVFRRKLSRSYAKKSCSEMAGAANPVGGRKIFTCTTLRHAVSWAAIR